MAKFTLFLATLCLFVAIALCQSHNWQVGVLNRYDRLLQRQIVKKSGFPLKKVTKDVTIPKGGQFYETISYVNATDQYQNGEGGYVSLLRGGPGAHDVTLHLKSQRGNGFNFILEVYGH